MKLTFLTNLSLLILYNNRFFQFHPPRPPRPPLLPPVPPTQKKEKSIFGPKFKSSFFLPHSLHFDKLKGADFKVFSNFSLKKSKKVFSPSIFLFE